MNLVHVRVQLGNQVLESEWLRWVFHSHALREEACEHVSIHSEGGGVLTVGFWIGAPSAVACEETAYTIAHRALNAESALHPARIASYSIAMVPELYDQMLQSPDEHGRNMRRTDAATPED